jgi:hypothetical protein
MALRPGRRPARSRCNDGSRRPRSRAHPGDPDPADRLGYTFESLYRKKLVHYVMPYAGDALDFPPRVALTRAGVDAFQQIRRRRMDPAARRPAARDALLQASGLLSA